MYGTIYICFRVVSPNIQHMYITRNDLDIPASENYRLYTKATLRHRRRPEVSR